LNTLRRLLFENAPQKILALALALALVAVKREDKIAVVTASVRIVINYPENRALVSGQIPKVDISVEGQYSAIRKFKGDQIPPLEINLSGLEGDPFYFEPDMFKVPPGLRVRSIRPTGMLLAFEERKKAELPIKAHLEGEPSSGYRLVQVEVLPPQVTVDGPASLVEDLEMVHTAPISLVGRSRSFSQDVPLTIPSGSLSLNLLNGRRRHKVSVIIEEKQGTMVVAGRPVGVRGLQDGPGFDLIPSRVDITLHGPVRLLNAVDPQAIQPYLDVSQVPRSLKIIRPGHKSGVTELRFDPPTGLAYSEINPKELTLLKKEAPPPIPAPPAPPKLEPKLEKGAQKSAPLKEPERKKP